MFRSMLCSLALMGLCVGFVAGQRDKGEAKDTTSKTDKKGKKGHHAKITKVDPKKGTITLKMKHKGKEVEKTFTLAEDAEYIDSNGNVATVDVFTSGDLVLVIEREGKIKKLQKRDKNKKSGSTKKPADK